MKFPAYKDLLKLTKEKINEGMAGPRANEMRKMAELEMAKLESGMAQKEQRCNELVSMYPIDFNQVLAAQDELALMTRRRDQFAVLITQLFPVNGDMPAAAVTGTDPASATKS